MKTLALIPFVAAIASAQTAPHAAWQNVQTVTITSPGFTRLDLPVSTLGAAQPGLDDLRLSDANGNDVPYVIEWPLPAATRQPAVQNFHVTLQPQRTVVEMETGTDKPIRVLMLDCAAPAFIKAISIEASNDRAQWTPLATDEMIFRQRDGAGRTTFIFGEPKPWAYLRATIRDDTSPPVPFTGARIEWQEPRTAPVPLAVTIAGRDELKGETKLRIDLGSANLSIAELKLRVADALFSRRITVQQNDRTIASHQVHRLTVNGRLTEELVVPLFAAIEAREITLVITNNDSPPLKVEGIDATRDPVGIAFNTASAGTLQLYSGNVAAPAPRYDVAALATDLRQANAATASVSALSANPAFNKAATMPETGAMGAMIDFKPWAYRKPVALRESGVVMIELDTETLAHAAETLSDLRLVQSGQQLPFILKRPGKTITLAATIQPEPDPKHPGVSRWRIKVPGKSLPVRSLTLTSPTPVFDRYLRLIEERRDSFGNRSSLALTSSNWSHVPTQQPSLTVGFYHRWQGDSILIETDNGDNAPIEINGAKAELDVVALHFKTTDPAPVHLYYGNTRALTPRYDVRLVEAALTQANSITGQLGAEEALSPTTETEPTTSGSPWLWIALGIVVIGLIAVMARMLPKAETSE
jgi:hypothetical protein